MPQLTEEGRDVLGFIRVMAALGGVHELTPERLGLVHLMMHTSSQDMIIVHRTFVLLAKIDVSGSPEAQRMVEDLLREEGQ